MSEPVFDAYLSVGPKDGDIKTPEGWAAIDWVLAATGTFVRQSCMDESDPYFRVPRFWTPGREALVSRCSKEDVNIYAFKFVGDTGEVVYLRGMVLRSETAIVTPGCELDYDDYIFGLHQAPLSIREVSEVRVVRTHWRCGHCTLNHPSRVSAVECAAYHTVRASRKKGMSDRDRAIVKRVQGGAPVCHVKNEFDLSDTRIRQIVRKDNHRVSAWLREARGGVPQ